MIPPSDAHEITSIHAIIPKKTDQFIKPERHSSKIIETFCFVKTLQQTVFSEKAILLCFCNL
jgi:hypothetical protein